MSNQLSSALLVRRRGVLVRRCDARRPCPRGASMGRATRCSSWSSAVPFSGPFPISARKVLVAGVERRGSGECGANSARNVVFSSRSIWDGVGLCGAPSNNALDLSVRPVTPVANCATGAPGRPAGQRER